MARMASSWSMASPLEALLLDEPGEQAGERLEEAHVGGLELAPVHGLDVEHAHDLVAPQHGHRAHRGIARLVHLADPREPGIDVDVDARDGRLLERREAREPLPQREARDADRLLVETVGGREGQAGPVAVHEVERADVGAGRRAGAVEDGAHELLERARGRGQLRDIREEGQLLEPARGVAARGVGRQDGLGHGLMVGRHAKTCNASMPVVVHAPEGSGMAVGVPSRPSTP